MQIIKIISLLLILISSIYTGVLISQKYCNRVKELKEIKKALNMFVTKIRYTYETIPEIFRQISSKTETSISNVFLIASTNMENMQASDAWENALKTINTSLNKDDINVLNDLGKLLGRVDLEGQISQIKLVDKFIDEQIENAEEEKKKYVKLYKSLGITIGLALVIIFI